MRIVIEMNNVKVQHKFNVTWARYLFEINEMSIGIKSIKTIVPIVTQTSLCINGN